ncbi:hypothetical protein WJX79_007323 [Trebouxia sp. C0005]
MQEIQLLKGPAQGASHTKAKKIASSTGLNTLSGFSYTDDMCDGKYPYIGASATSIHRLRTGRRLKVQVSKRRRRCQIGQLRRDAVTNVCHPGEEHSTRQSWWHADECVMGASPLLRGG